MALVAYSDESDVSDNEEVEQSMKVEDIPKIKSNNTTDGSAFLSIPAAKKTVSVNFELNDVVDDVPTVQTWSLTKNVEIKKLQKNNKMKFILPKLSDFSDDEDISNEKEENPRKRIKTSPEEFTSSLMSILPPPKKKEAEIRKEESIKKFLKPKKSETVSRPSNEFIEEEMEIEDFFSLSKKDEVLPNPIFPVTSLPQNLSHSDKNISIPKETIETSSLNSPIDTVDSYNFNSNAIDNIKDSKINNSNLPSFIKDNKNIEFVDIKADDYRSTRDEWLTKTLSEEKPTHSFSKKKQGGPSQQAKRKHQITYLAEQAKEREQELKNSWATSRHTKYQTQAKYGF